MLWRNCLRETGVWSKSVPLNHDRRKCITGQIAADELPAATVPEKTSSISLFSGIGPAKPLVCRSFIPSMKRSKHLVRDHHQPVHLTENPYRFSTNMK